MSRFVIVCPKGITTGGPEALHQLASQIADHGHEVRLWDSDEVRGSTAAAAAYEGYKPIWTNVSPGHGDIIVIPEVYGNLIPRFYLECRIVFWWLSVDNFFGSDNISIDVMKHSFPNLIHCYQSDYARDFLELSGITGSLPLSDYLNDDFVRMAASKSDQRTVINSMLIAVNPAKGFERTSKVLDIMNTETVIRLENMSRSEVVNSLLRAEIYLDLGNHPGKDRIPREAALLNCIVVTNTRGSAGNQVDVPIEQEVFKFDDTAAEFEKELIPAINKMIASPEDFLFKQNLYRAKILESKEIFAQEVEQLLQVVTVQESTVNTKLDLSESLLIKLVANLLNERDSAVNERDSAVNERDSAVNERDISISKLHQVKNSLSWKVTRPLRLGSLFFKNLYRASHRQND